MSEKVDMSFWMFTWTRLKEERYLCGAWFCFGMLIRGLMV